MNNPNSPKKRNYLYIELHGTEVFVFVSDRRFDGYTPVKRYQLDRECNLGINHVTAGRSMLVLELDDLAGETEQDDEGQSNQTYRIAYDTIPNFFWCKHLNAWVEDEFRATMFDQEEKDAEFLPAHGKWVQIS